MLTLKEISSVFVFVFIITTDIVRQIDKLPVNAVQFVVEAAGVADGLAVVIASP